MNGWDETEMVKITKKTQLEVGRMIGSRNSVESTPFRSINQISVIKVHPKLSSSIPSLFPSILIPTGSSMDPTKDCMIESK